MRETIIKLLTSKNNEDVKLGKNYLYKFYKEDILARSGTSDRFIILSNIDLSEILLTKMPNLHKYWIIWIDDMV